MDDGTPPVGIACGSFGLSVAWFSLLNPFELNRKQPPLWVRHLKNTSIALQGGGAVDEC